MMDSLLERIEDNKLDALYLFINDTLRDPVEFERFFTALLGVLPNNYSIQRVEFGHEFLSMCTRQGELFEIVCMLESLKTLIISDGYVPRKDTGCVQTNALLSNLPRARNLTNLDLQRLELCSEEHVEMLVDAFETLHESLEDVRITSLNLWPNAPGLDDVFSACVDMTNLRSLAMSARPCKRALLSKERILELCQNSTTLQDLSLRSMNLTDDMCRTIASALETSTFLTSLDIRQNDEIGTEGYYAILHALERNYDLWCTVMVVSTTLQPSIHLFIFASISLQSSFFLSSTGQ